MSLQALDDTRFEIEREVVRRRFGRAARTYDAASVLARETARRMDERLEYVKLQPRRLLDVGCGTGADLRLLAERYPQALRLGCDFALPMLRAATEELPWIRRLLPGGRARQAQLLCADSTRLPLVRGAVSLVWSNLMLHWMSDPLPALKEMHRVLEVDGLLMFTALGPDTLLELRKALARADPFPHVHRFLDMHDLGDALVAAGFADPVMDMEILTLTYERFDQLTHDLHTAGATCAAAGRRRGLSGKSLWQQARQHYEVFRRDSKLPATFEIIYGHAWKAQARTTDAGLNIVQFDPKARASRP
jgi:malonyl-CoA O-methyltransferase